MKDYKIKELKATLLKQRADFGNVKHLMMKVIFTWVKQGKINVKEMIELTDFVFIINDDETHPDIKKEHIDAVTSNG